MVKPPHSVEARAGTYLAMANGKFGNSHAHLVVQKLSRGCRHFCGKKNSFFDHAGLNTAL
jgi:hypothetical protein